MPTIKLGKQLPGLYNCSHIWDWDQTDLFGPSRIIVKGKADSLIGNVGFDIVRKAYEFRDTHKHIYSVVSNGWMELREATEENIVDRMSENTERPRAQILECECSSTEHNVVYYYAEDDNEVYMHVHLTKQPFFKRLWVAIKYIFGYQSKYGAFDEHILDYNQVPQLRELADALEKRQKERNRRAAEQF